MDASWSRSFHGSEEAVVAAVQDQGLQVHRIEIARVQALAQARPA
jgi:hypothetical protein